MSAMSQLESTTKRIRSAGVRIMSAMSQLESTTKRIRSAGVRIMSAMSQLESTTKRIRSAGVRIMSAMSQLELQPFYLQTTKTLRHTHTHTHTHTRIATIPQDCARSTPAQQLDLRPLPLCCTLVRSAYTQSHDTKEAASHTRTHLGLARTVYLHRI